MNTVQQVESPDAQIRTALAKLFDISLDRFTGRVVIHFQDGVAMEAEPTSRHRRKKTE